MNSTREIIEDLRRESKGRVFVMLVVAFDDHFEQVDAKLSDYDALVKLNKFVTDGGSPIGYLIGRMEGGFIVMETRLLDHNEGHLGAIAIMEEVAEHTRKHFGIGTN